MRKQYDLVGIGVSVFDIVMVVDQIPSEETVVRASERAVGLGGGIAVASATAASLGGRVAFCDSLGFDPLSDSILSVLQSASVDVSCVERSPGQTASVANVMVNEDSGARTIVYSPGTTSELGWSNALEEMVASCGILHFNGRHLETCKRAVEVAQRNGAKISFDGGAHRYRQEILPLVKASDILIVAEHFAQSHWQARGLAPATNNADQLVEFLIAEFDCSLAGVTCGEQGSWLGTSGGDRWHQPASGTTTVRDTTVRDTTGCGDTYHGAFLYAMAKGLEPRECSEVAAIVSADNTNRLGAYAIDAASLRKALCDRYQSLGQQTR